MEINGCLIVSEPAETPEGWTSTVTRDGLLKGPFQTIQQAIHCAQTWTASPGPAVYVEQATPPHDAVARPVTEPETPMK